MCWCLMFVTTSQWPVTIPASTPGAGKVARQENPQFWWVLELPVCVDIWSCWSQWPGCSDRVVCSHRGLVIHFEAGHRLQPHAAPEQIICKLHLSKLTFCQTFSAAAFIFQSTTGNKLCTDDRLRSQAFRKRLIILQMCEMISVFNLQFRQCLTLASCYRWRRQGLGGRRR